MAKPIFLVLAVLSSATAAGGQQPLATSTLESAGKTVTVAKLMHRIEALAHDSMLGRGPGQRGDTMTTRYLAREMERIGLTPAGRNGFLQPVAMKRGFARGSAAFFFRDREISLRADEQVFQTVTTAGTKRLSAAPLILVGHGIAAPEFRWDDYKGKSLAGKVAVILDHEPAALGKRSFSPVSGSTYHAMWFVRARYAMERGAAGVVIVRTGSDSAHAVRSRRGQHEATIGDLPSPIPLPPVTIQISASAADALARNIGDSLTGWLARAADSSFAPVELPLTVSVEQDVTTRSFESSNVIGVIRGSDPELRDECVVYAAHWDAYGIGPAVRGDSIYNGALDNAGGVSSMLAIAEATRALPRPPARTMVFLATTAEETGLLGANAYIANPVCPMEKTQLVIGADWTWTWGPTDTISSNGYGYSTVDSLAGSIARRIGKAFTPGWSDYWMASDHAAFLTKGVPSWFGGLDGEVTGKPKGWAMQQLMSTATHVPRDEILPTWNMEGSVEETRFLFELGVRAAEMKGRLRWINDSEFARAAKKGSQGSSSSEAEWPAYGRDALGSRFSPLAQIDRTNVARLSPAWTFRTGEPLPEQGRRRSLEVTPIVVNGVMYISTPLGKVFAIDPVAGTARWSFDAKVDPGNRFGDFTNRGVSSWRDRIYLATTDARLIALDASSGQPIASFGTNGTVDLRKGLRNAPFEFAEYEVTSPAAVVGDLLVVGSAVADNNRTDAATGEVRAYDARTGALRWSWDPVPQDPSDPQHRTWEGANAHRTGAANAWSVIAADPERDLVFVPTSAPSPDYYGGERLGRNDYANSIVALRASTGKVVWHFQTVHHDLWDYDNASPPLLATVRGQPAVIQTTKTGMMFVLNRETGTPIFPVEERRVPASTIPGERAWPTQPFSSLPALSPHTWDAQSPVAACQEIMRGLRNEGIFTPPSFEGTLVMPSNIGGAHWGGLTFDPARQIAVVPVNRLAATVQILRADSASIESLRPSRSRRGYEDTRMRGTPYIMRRKILFVPPGVPCTPDPPGALVAIDLVSGTKAWETPLAPNLGGPIATAGGLVFLAATVDPFIRAFDIDTGRELWRAELPGGGKATPMTYRGSDGRQYVVIAAGGDGETWKPSDAIVAFALPR